MILQVKPIHINNRNLKWIYEVVKEKCGALDAVYEEYIIYLVGVVGLEVLKNNDLIESYGVINGKRLVVLKDI